MGQNRILPVGGGGGFWVKFQGKGIILPRNSKEEFCIKFQMGREILSGGGGGGLTFWFKLHEAGTILPANSKGVCGGVCDILV